MQAPGPAAIFDSMGQDQDDAPPAGAADIDEERLARDRTAVLRGFWDKVAGNLDRVPFLDEAVAAYYAARDPATPVAAKAALFAALAYFIMPADMVPDLLAGLGFTDDAAVLYAALRRFAPHVTDEHRRRARAALARSRTDGEET